MTDDERRQVKHINVGRVVLALAFLIHVLTS